MIESEKTAEIIGGTAILGSKGLSGLDWVKTIRTGLPVAAAQHMLKTGWLTATEMDRVVLPRKTLYNRRLHGTLTAEQSDRLLRVARILALTQETFGDDRKAQEWLRRPTQVLSGERPLDLLDTDEGARAVETVLGRIAHGIAA